MRTWVCLISVFLLLVSCAKSSNLGSPIPDTGPTIPEIYDEHMNSTGELEFPRRALSDGTINLEGYSRDVYNELSVHFPRLPNPTIVLYVFPHLSPEDAPVPGYSTIFQLYERTQYALPYELQSQ